MAEIAGQVVHGPAINAHKEQLCACHGCIARATHALKVWMPVINAGPNESKTVSMIAGVKLCEYHADHLGPYDVLDRAAIVSFIKRACKAKGLKRPDFTQAQVQKIPLDCRAVHEHEATMKKATTNYLAPRSVQRRATPYYVRD